MTEPTDTGGGTTTNFCPPSPADLAKQIDNILTRLSGLEDAVASLASQDTNAVQLSDISPSVGWVYNVTYMGIPGWTQTEAGTLIPPPGFSISTLDLFPNGESTSGISGGSVSSAWYENGGAHQLISNGSNKYLDFTAIDLTSSDPDSLVTVGTIGSGGSAGGKLTLNNDGVYQISFYFEMEAPGVTDFGQIVISMNFGGESFGNDSTVFSFDQNTGAVYTNPIGFVISRLIHGYAGDTFFVNINNSSTAGQYFTWYSFGLARFATV